MKRVMGKIVFLKELGPASMSLDPNFLYSFYCNEWW